MRLALWQSDRSPRVRRATVTLIPAASTSAVSVQVPGFEDNGLLTHGDRLVCDSCSSGQCFAFGFLQIPTHDGHPCRSANRSPCRAGRGLSPPSRPGRPPQRAGTAPVKALRAMPGAPKKKPRPKARLFSSDQERLLGDDFYTTVHRAAVTGCIVCNRCALAHALHGHVTGAQALAGEVIGSSLSAAL